MIDARPSIRAFLDANVLFSASNAGSNISRLMKLLLDLGTAVTSDFAIEEVRRNLEIKRPGWVEESSRIAEAMEIVPSVQFPLSVEIVDKDKPILCAAIRSGCDVLVTGDRQHFGHLYDQEVQGVAVVTLLRLAEMLAEASDKDS